MPGGVGLPRNQTAEPGNAGRAVIIGNHDDEPAKGDQREDTPKNYAVDLH
jgi:hypothetical protein